MPSFAACSAGRSTTWVAAVRFTLSDVSRSHGVIMAAPVAVVTVARGGA
jgi:hypothetical protein